jgi:methylenetetrahydrofolate reductase (NADPH)
MHIKDIIKRDGMTFSFEFFPPSSDAGWIRLFERIIEFERLGPSFVSVTYGAGGSTRQQTQALVMRLRHETNTPVVPHLTCCGHDTDTIHSIIGRYADAGVSNILAIRGDQPRDAEASTDTPDAFDHAADLVDFIQQFNRTHLHGQDRAGFGILAAGFPEGHPETPNRLRQIEHLKAKVDAGVDVLITQMFFDNRAFHDWREHCELMGINIPVIAGIMPITSVQNMKRMADLAAGTNFPSPLLRAIYRAQDDPEAVRKVGIHWATEQCRDLIDQGVAGIHFYTLNQSESTKEIFSSLGARDTSALRRDPHPAG